MKSGLIFLMLGYVLSQFFRSFLAVLSPLLTQELGMSPQDLSRASGLWFLTFAACQLPLGLSLDRIGPRLTCGVLLGVCGAGGALLIANAQSALWIDLGMALIGIGCAPVLIAGYFILARAFPPQMFATLAAAMVGVGMVGDLASSLPMAWSTEAFGWRATMVAVAVVTLVFALLILAFVKDPPRVDHAASSGGILSMLRPGPLWLVLAILLVGYGPIAATRGLWVGSYLEAMHGLDPTGIGAVTTVLALCMTCGTFVVGPLDRRFGTRKWVVFGAVIAAATCFAALSLLPGAGLITHAAIICLAGFFSMSYAVQMAHGRAFFPPHLAGRGVALLNLFSVGAVGVFQLVSGRIYVAVLPQGAAAAYSAIFAFFAVAMVVGCFAYLFSTDRMD